MRRNLVGPRAVVTLATVVLALFAAGSAFAQGTSTYSDDWRVVSIPNQYITGKLGVSGTASSYDTAGRWSVVLAGGDPEVKGDDGIPLVFMGDVSPAGYFGYWKVKVGTKIYIIGDSNSGYWSKTPVYYATPPAGYGVGRSGGFIDSEWTITETAVAVATVRIRMSLVRDQVRFELLLTNKAKTAASIGLQMHGDVTINSGDLNEFAFIPGIGYVRQGASLVGPRATLLSGSSIPAVLEVVDAVEAPVTDARLTLGQQDAVMPDYVAFGEWNQVCSTAPATWWLPTDFAPDPLESISDLAYVLCWSPRALAAGASKKIVTYYGCGAASAAWNYRAGARMEVDSAALAVQGPRALKYNTDDAKTTSGDVDPTPFTVKAYLYNMAIDPGPYNLEDVTVTLYLPKGLELEAQVPAQTAQQTIGSVDVNSEALPVSWSITANGRYCGELEYFVTARAASGWQQVVSRKIMVPATKQSVLRSGYQLVSVPFTFNNPGIDHVFGLSKGTYGARYYDPKTGQYLPLSQLKAGQSFWLYYSGVPFGGNLPFTVAADAAIVGHDTGKQTKEQYVDIQPGWNLVGNPFVYPVYWGQVMVYNRVTNTTVSLDQAVTNNWLSKTIFTWIPDSGAYESFKDGGKLLLPWRGYWVRAKYPVTLVFRPAVFLGTDVTANADGT